MSSTQAWADFEPRLAQQPAVATVLPIQALPIDQQAEAFLEGERVGVRRLALVLEGLRHAVQFQ